MSGETYSTMHCVVKVTNRVYTTEQVDINDLPFKYVIKDADGKLLAHLIFSDKTKEIQGIEDADLLAIVDDRVRIRKGMK